MTFAPPTTELRPAPNARKWSITWRGQTWTEDDLSGEHLAVLAVLNGSDDWQSLNMLDVSPTVGVVRLMSMISAFVAVSVGNVSKDGVAHAVAAVRAAPAEEILAALQVS